MFMLTPPSAFACKLRLLFKNSVSAKCMCFNIWGKKYQGQIQSFNFSLILRSGNMILAEWAQTQWQNGLHIFKKAQHLGESRLLFWKPGISKLGEIMQFNHSDYLQYAACYAFSFQLFGCCHSFHFVIYVSPLTSSGNVATYFSSPSTSWELIKQHDKQRSEIH